MNVKRIVPLILSTVFLFCAALFAQEDASAVSGGSALEPEAALEAALVDPAQDGEGNLIWVQDATGAAGSMATVKVLLTVDQDLYGAWLELIFDQSKLQLVTLAENGITRGADAGGLLELVLDEDAVTAANSAGKLVVAMIDTTLAEPLTAGAESELLKVKFVVGESVEVGDIPITLANVSLASVVDDAPVDVEVSMQDGKLTVAEFAKGDVSGDGTVNIFDLLDLLKVISGKDTAAGAVDVNGDGVTNIFDLLELLKVLAGK